MRKVFIFLFLTFGTIAQEFSSEEINLWAEQADNVTIIRDHYGVPHIYGNTDADAIFGMLYAQCEDDFKRIERNYLEAIGSLSEAYGKEYLFRDLRARMFMSEAEAIELYQNSPAWLQDLCDAFAAGINYYLHTHPAVSPDFIKRFEPWMPFTFSEGSIGGDITRASLNGIEAFYGEQETGYIDNSWSLEEELTGSNGISIAPGKSISGNALFLINPHTSYYFRSETHVNSREGLKAYGAVTWGQFFIYQGFNEYCGWMHTSTYADAIDQYIETIKKEGEDYFYLHGNDWRKVDEEKITVPYKSGDEVLDRHFKVFKTHHGPVIRKEGDKWITFRMMERPMDALIQSFTRTKARNYREFEETMNIRTNSSNNTVYADRAGNIAYWHGNFIPKRNPSYDYNGLIDGSNPEMDWQGLHELDEMVMVLNPDNAWIQNCNSTPFTAAGSNSPLREDFADYIAPDLENYRGINAVRALEKFDVFDLDSLKMVANDPYLAAFPLLVEALFEAYYTYIQKNDELGEAIALLNKWDFNYGEGSVETSLAIFWAEELYRVTRPQTTISDRREMMMAEWMIRFSNDEEKIAALVSAMNKLKTDFGSWKTPWGEINRFQRLTGKIVEEYDDQQVSIPIGFTSSRWGSLASGGGRTRNGTVKRYGSGGNSFVALVEFGDRLVAKSIVSGGQSSNPDSPHFIDQAEKFCKGEFKDVLYYKEDVVVNAAEKYHPGERL